MIRFCAWLAVFSRGLFTRKPSLLDFAVLLRTSDCPQLLRLLGHDCALSISCARTTCFSAQKVKKRFSSVSRNGTFSALVQPWNVTAAKHPSHVADKPVMGGSEVRELFVPSFLCPTNWSSPECGVRGDQILKTCGCFHSPHLHLSAKISLAPMQKFACSKFLPLPSSDSWQWGRVISNSWS